MKIPFDIKYKPQIESGEYKVETRDGLAATDIHLTKYRDENVVVYYVGRDMWICGEEGNVNIDKTECKYDLFIITPEPELSNFEKALEVFLMNADSSEETFHEEVKKHAAELLEIAKDEIYSHESLVEYAKKAKEEGKAEALKDLPRWKKATGKERFNERIIVLTGDNDLLCTNYAEEGEYYISFSAIEKLPKED